MYGFNYNQEKMYQAVRVDWYGIAHYIHGRINFYTFEEPVFDWYDYNYLECLAYSTDSRECYAPLIGWEGISIYETRAETYAYIYDLKTGQRSQERLSNNAAVSIQVSTNIPQINATINGSNVASARLYFGTAVNATGTNNFYANGVLVLSVSF